MRKVSGDYLRRAQIIKHRQGDRQEEARLRSLSKQADQQADEIEERIRADPADLDGRGEVTLNNHHPRRGRRRNGSTRCSHFKSVTTTRWTCKILRQSRKDFARYL